jgi:ATP/maltotriose-dependent transcriptional regulator MalT
METYHINNPIENAVRIIQKFKKRYENEVKKIEEEKQISNTSLNGNTDFFKRSSQEMAKLCKDALSDIEKNKFNFACYVLKRILNRHPLTSGEHDEINLIYQNLKNL